MNPIRLVGDFVHIYAMILLLRKIIDTKSCAGISGRSQILFALVYTSRYLDVFFNFISAYNSCMKALFIAVSWCTLHLIYHKFKATLDGKHDTFRIEFLVIPLFILALFVNYGRNFLEVSWAFSIYLESAAILPQMYLVSTTGEIRTVISHYLLCMGSYRALYILNWVFRYYHEGFIDQISIFGGVIETIIYCIFFLLYVFKSYKTYEEVTSGTTHFFTDWLIAWDDDYGDETVKGKKFTFPPTEYNKPPPYWFAVGQNNRNCSSLCCEAAPQYSVIDSVADMKTKVPDIVIAKGNFVSIR